MGALKLGNDSRTVQQGVSPPQLVQSEGARDVLAAGSVGLVPGSGFEPDFWTRRLQAQPGTGADQAKVRRTAVSAALRKWK